MKHFNPFKMTKILAMFVCLSWSYGLLMAQSHVVRVTAPANLVANYPAEMAYFGPAICSLSGDLVLAKSATNATSGCTAAPIANDLTGKIAVVDRGGCDFTEKVLNAQNKGAIGVIVLNNTGSTVLGIMTGTNALIKIPSLMISQVAGNTLRSALENGTTISVSISRSAPDFVAASQIVWGANPKEGEFEGGLNGWRTNTVSCSGPTKPANVWAYLSFPGTFPSPCITTGQLVFNSPSRCNGFMIMNAATLDLASSTACTNFGLGPCPAPHVAELISPTIKVTKGTPLNVSFYQELTHFFDTEYFVEWSKDGGKTWTSTQINEEIRPYESNDDLYKSVRLLGSETADSIKIKFTYNGNYYHWAIDDVKLIKREANNLAVTDYYAVTPNLQQPLAQAEPIAFSAAVENIGAKAQTNLKLYINAIDSTTNARVFRDSLVSASIAPNQIDTAIFEPKFVPNKKGTYAMIYQTSADSADYDRFDNVQGHYFRVTDTIFAKEFGGTLTTSPSAGNWDPGEPHSAAYGNSYYVVKGKGNYLRSVTFGINNGADLTGLSLLFSLYKWEDRNFNASAEATERTLVADNFYDIKGTETGARLITFPFPEAGEPPVQLEDSTNYLIVCEFYTGEEIDLEFLMNDSYDRFPMLLTSFAANEPRYASVTELDSDLATATYSGIGFGFENVYVLRMNVGPLVISSDKDVPSITNEFAISPNPAREVAYLQLALNKVAKQANVRIMDLAGRTVIEKAYNNIQRDQLQFSVNGLPAGTYLMQVTTENGTGTKKFVVAGK